MAGLSRAGRVLPLVAVLGLAPGCSDSETPAGLRGAPMVIAEGEGACGLLASAELELVLNAPVKSKDRSTAAAASSGEPETATAQSPPARPASQDRSDAHRPPLLPGMHMCRVSSQEGRIIWGVLADADTEEPLEEIFHKYREWHGDYLEGTSVDGHDAVWDQELRTLVVLADDHAVGVRLTVPNLPTADDTDDGDAGKQDGNDAGDSGEDDEEANDEQGSAELQKELDEDEAAYLRAQAEELARRALRRL